MTPFEPPAGRAVHSLDLIPGPADFDENGHVNNVVYVRWIQNAATSHWSTAQIDDPDQALGWVLLRHEIDYRRPLLPGQAARARTWVGEARGPRFDRFVRIDGLDGEMCAQALSTWCLIDRRSGRPRRVPAEIVGALAGGT